MMGTILSIQTSLSKGVEKTPVSQARLIADWGLEADAHGGAGDRQVSIFPIEALSFVPDEKVNEVNSGGYTENITISGIPLDELIPGNLLRLGSHAIVRICHIGKNDKKDHGRPYIVSREGRFGIVVQGGMIHQNDAVAMIDPTESRP